jgi:hypothetical protein
MWLKVLKKNTQQIIKFSKLKSYLYSTGLVVIIFLKQTCEQG